MARCNKCGKPSSLGHRCDPYDRRRYSGTSNQVNSSDTYVPDIYIDVPLVSNDSDRFSGGGGDFGGGGSSGSWDSGSSSSSD